MSVVESTNFEPARCMYLQGTIPKTEVATQNFWWHHRPVGGAIFALPRYDGMLRRVIYISRSMIGADPKQLEAIISTSIHRNEPFELTGMLWADGRSFAQVIEGDPHHLEQAMDRIRKDRRHKDIEVLLDRLVSSRQFGNWSMRQAVDDEANAHATTFMIGFAMGQRTNAAKRLYEIVLGSERH